MAIREALHLRPHCPSKPWAQIVGTALATDPYLATTFSAACLCAASSRASMSGVRPCGKRLTRRSLLAKSGAGGVSRRSPTWENCPALSASYETSVTVSRARTKSAVSCTARSSPCALPPLRSSSATATPSGPFAGANRSTLPPMLHPSVASRGPHTQLRLTGPSFSRGRLCGWRTRAREPPAPWPISGAPSGALRPGTPPRQYRAQC